MKSDCWSNLGKIPLARLPSIWKECAVNHCGHAGSISLINTSTEGLETNDGNMLGEGGRQPLLSR